jgi:alpha-tubulin suppressor-like RCC1 family protein
LWHAPGGWGYDGRRSLAMKKWLTRCAVAAALILIALLLVMVLQPNAPGIRTGKPLPPGKVRPRLANTTYSYSRDGATMSDAAILLAPDGSLWAWGGTYSSLTNVFPQPAISHVPHRIGSDSDWTQVASGRCHTVALKNDGSLWAWGRNDEGEVGQGNFTNHYGTPTRIGMETNWAQICAGDCHSLALKNDGSLWAWGMNNKGQLGDGTTNNRSVPTMIGTDRDWRMMTASIMNSFALKSNGTLWGWGGGSPGFAFAPKQVEPGTHWLAISAYFWELLALKTDGTLWLKGPSGHAIAPAFISVSTERFTQIGQDTAWAEVYQGSFSFFACKKDGSWWVCGENYQGQLGLGTGVPRMPSPQRLPFGFDPWAFAPGWGTTLMLGKDGKLWTWGLRLGAGRPSAARLKIEALLSPLVKRFPGLRFLIKSDIDRTPRLLWELPPEVRRSLGAGQKSVTNHVTSGLSAADPARPGA